ncbi:NAD(P)/FAD-dependent oxidoreductase [Paracoccus sp. S3-43]|uniref:NAD(P)/FAD-dependent oxidoreductase n=1 Tax=Paracoccus sp. S3-43 TaxID=3030011 RepID=UPI0023AE7E7A|nr:NAD(P)/FAD-dependent oxidoreductase [Paracoccus sp. S3-43]WEF24866.1 NAD(P)-binding domain-containing protein [Paracoccus sp. S3-43]
MTFDGKRRIPGHVPDHVTVAIVGAGPAGLGVARVLRDLAIPDVWVLERGRIGQSFLRWPSGTRLLTPSFPGNVFGLTDLNAISYDSSPGWSLKREHPDGGAYAGYLEQAALAFGLNVQCGIDVAGIRPEGEGFILETDRGAIAADFVIWAGGQFGTPSDAGIIGADLGRHYATIARWADVPGDPVFVIGGYESGVDAALGLARAGKRVTVLGRGAPWEDADKDPGRALSPFTRQRLDAGLKKGAVTLVKGAEVIALEPEPEGIRILSGDGRSWLSATPPILATGFASGTARVSEWFDYADSGLPLLTAQDESTALPGLFLVGPEVSHNGHLFCFIYKFRQRFAVVARAIAGRLGADTAALETYRTNNMYLDDLACCDADKCLC